MAYVTNDELRAELLRSNEQNEITPELLNLFKRMSESFIRKYPYDIKDRETLYESGTFACVKHWKEYPAEKTNNAFAYFAQIIKCAVAYNWKKLHPKAKITEI